MFMMIDEHVAAVEEERVDKQEGKDAEECYLTCC